MKNLKMFLICTILLSNNFWGQDKNFDELVQIGIKQIYNLQFMEAGKTFAEVRNLYPNDPAGKFFEAMILWWRIMLDFDEERLDNLFIKKLNEVIEDCDKILDKEPDNVNAMFLKGGSLGFRGRLATVRESWIDAAYDGKDALPLVYKAYELDPQNVDVQFGLGIYNYYAAVIPEKYEFVKPLMLMFPSGNKNKGLTQLKNAATNGKFTKAEAKYFLMTLYYGFEEDYESAMKYAKQLKNEFPDNPTFEKYYGRILIKQSKFTEAKNGFSAIMNKCEKGFVGYNKRVKREAYFYLGVSNFHEAKYDVAKFGFRDCLQLSKELDGSDVSGYQINSLLYLGMIYDKLGMRDAAVQKYKEVLKYKNYGRSHSLAESYLKDSYR
ncbi:MAG: DUF3808 domain-containing protein [Ignavibacteriales bacterium]|nr:DUF3808 domain-containing protein [Ignavibacteriales bacterium]